MKEIEGKKELLVALTVVGATILGYWKPYVLIEGVQRAGLYAAITLPMALLMGLIGIVNLAHGDFMMLGAYLAYGLSVYFGLDPLISVLPAIVVFFLFGAIVYLGTFKHVLDAPELNQILLAFGLMIILTQGGNLLWTSRFIKISLPYVSESLTIGSLTFGTYEFVYVAAALLILIGLRVFLKKTRMGQAALAVGQHRRGAKLVGINVDWTHLIIFSLSIAIIGAMGCVFITRHSISPFVGFPFTLRAFCLIAMAGIGNLTGILWVSLLLGIAENMVISFHGYAGWSDLIYFILIIAVIMVKSRKRQRQ
jgi:branched-chain amino acid transport system permease protein